MGDIVGYQGDGVPALRQACGELEGGFAPDHAVDIAGWFPVFQLLGDLQHGAVFEGNEQLVNGFAVAHVHIEGLGFGIGGHDTAGEWPGKLLVVAALKRGLEGFFAGPFIIVGAVKVNGGQVIDAVIVQPKVYPHTVEDFYQSVIRYPQVVATIGGVARCNAVLCSEFA